MKAVRHGFRERRTRGVFPVAVSVFAEGIHIEFVHHYRGHVSISPREALRLADALTKAADALSGVSGTHRTTEEK
jgi:phage portal protein BeeE